MYIAWLFPIRSLSISLQKNYKTGKRKYPVDEENALLLLGFLFFFCICICSQGLWEQITTNWAALKKKNGNLSFRSSEVGIPKSRC